MAFDVSKYVGKQIAWKIVKNNSGLAELRELNSGLDSLATAYYRETEPSHVYTATLGQRRAFIDEMQQLQQQYPQLTDTPDAPLDHSAAEQGDGQPPR